MTATARRTPGFSEAEALMRMSFTESWYAPDEDANGYRHFIRSPESSLR